MRRTQCTAAVLSALVGSSMAFGQDSVALTPGGNDALSSFDGSSQRVRYVVDLAPATTSWNNPILVGPVLKSSRDTNPTFNTQVLGSVALSPNLATGLSFASKPYASWTGAGAGVNATYNATPASSNASAFASQFGIAVSDFSLSPSSIEGATVGRVSGQFNRLWVERVVAVSSRSSAAALDTSTASLGGVDALGNVALRADNFNTATTTSNRVLGDSIVRVDLTARGSSVNTLQYTGGTNAADDAASSTFILSNAANPTNTPSIVNQPGVGPFALVYDFASQFTTGSSVTNLVTGTSHVAGLGLAGHRGNPGYSPISAAGGAAGTVASIAMPSPTGAANRLLAFGLNFGTGGSAPTVAAGTQGAYTLPSPISAGAFTANSSGQAAFKQYLSQTPWRGGNGQVAIGQNASGQLMLAATASDTSAGDFIAVATVTSPGTATWTIAAYPGASVLDGPSGNVLGTITTPAASFSAPAMDRLGNVYFVATWKPALTPQENAVFKAVNTAGGYKLEAVLRQGQTITGVNSATPYTITSITLTDSDSIASGTMFSQNVIQQQDPAATTADPTKARAFGGLVVSTVITYNNAGTPESYDAALYVGATQGSDCKADFNNSGTVTVQDIFDFLAAWFAHDPRADFNGSGLITVQDIFDFLSAWFAGCH